MVGCMEQIFHNVESQMVVVVAAVAVVERLDLLG